MGLNKRKQVFIVTVEVSESDLLPPKVVENYIVHALKRFDSLILGKEGISYFDGLRLDPIFHVKEIDISREYKDYLTESVAHIKAVSDAVTITWFRTAKPITSDDL